MERATYEAASTKTQLLSSVFLVHVLQYQYRWGEGKYPNIFLDIVLFRIFQNKAVQ